MGDMIVCDQDCLGVCWTSGPFSGDKSQSSLVDEAPGEEIYDNWVSFGQFVFRQVREVQRKPHPGFSLFQVLVAQNNQ